MVLLNRMSRALRGGKMHTWSVERAVHRVCETVRGIAAVLLAPVFDWVYPQLAHTRAVPPPTGCPDRADCREFSCAGYCSEPSEPSAYREPTVSTARLDELVGEIKARFPEEQVGLIKRDLDFYQQGEQGGGPW